MLKKELTKEKEVYIPKEKLAKQIGKAYCRMFMRKEAFAKRKLRRFYKGLESKER